MDKLTAIRIKYDDGTYSEEIPVSALAEDIIWNSSHNLVDILGEVDLTKGNIQQQLNEKFNTDDISTYVDTQISTDVTAWLNEHVNPVGSAVVVDNSLTTAGAAADAQKTGEYLRAIISEYDRNGGGYPPGTYVVHNNLLYQSLQMTAFAPPAPPNSDYWRMVSLNKAISELLGIVAEPYRGTGEDYTVGDYCIYNNILYKCTTAIQTSGSFDSSKWEVVDKSLIEMLSEKAEQTEVDQLNEHVAEIDDVLGYESETRLEVDGLNENNSSTTVIGNSPFILNNINFLAPNNIVSKIILNVSTAGTLSLGTIKKENAVNQQPYDRNDVDIKSVINIEQTGIVEVNVEPFEVESDEYLAICMPTDTCKWIYGASGTDKGFLYAPTGGNWANAYASSLGMNIYSTSSFFPITLDELNTKITDIENVFLRTVMSVNGYNVDNVTISSTATAPFVYQNIDFDYDNMEIESIQLDVTQVGTLSIGVIKKEDAISGEAWNKSDAVVKEQLNITNIGYQTINISTPFTVNSDEYLFIGMPTDGAKWKYGYSGIDKTFLYCDGVGSWVISGNSLGINVYAKTINADVRHALKSIYKNKKLSILGDSISTFTGYIPEGNVTYYPSGTVTNVSDTWWYKLFTALGMELDVNNSWSGSRVTTTNGNDSAGCMNRCEALGESPDVIIVWMGINDFNNEVQLGIYDGKSSIPSVTTTFREAYAIMLNKILTKYQRSEVWVCTLPQCERNAETGFPEINGNGVSLAEYNEAIRELANAFGVRVLEHAKCGLTYQNMPVYNPDNLHPNKYGHSLIANNDIWQMDNAVSTRYSIS